MTMATLDHDIDLAQAEADLQNLAGGADDGALRAALDRITGGQSSKVEATNGADQWVTMYHRYDGRTHSVPRYMVAKLLTARLLPDNDLYPREVQGQQAWSLEAGKAGELKAEYGPFDVSMGLPCYFSSAQHDPRILADRDGAGIPAFCRKNGKDGTPVLFSDALNLASHMKKHRNALPAFDKYRAERRELEREAQAITSQDAMAEMVRTLMEQRGTSAIFDGECDTCDFVAKNAAGLTKHKRTHSI